jgi:hypothetical protein
MTLAMARYSASALEDDILMLRGSGDKIVAKEHSITRGTPRCVRITRTISISIDDELGGG